MSTQRAGNGATQLSNQQWFDEIAQEVVRNASLTSRLVTVVEKLTDRLELLESSETVQDPQPADFDLDEQVELTDEGREIIEEPEPSEDIDLGPTDDGPITNADELEEIATEQPAQDEELRVSIPQPILLNSLKTVAKAVARSTVNPVLNNVRLSFGKGELGISATDGEISIRQVLPAGNDRAEGLLVPAKLFLETIKGLPKVDLALDFRDNALHIEEGGASFSVGTSTAEEFPELPNCSDGAVSYVSCYKLKRLLHRAGFAAVRESSTGLSITPTVCSSGSRVRSWSWSRPTATGWHTTSVTGGAMLSMTCTC